MSSRVHPTGQTTRSPFSGRVLTEQEAISQHLRYLADHLGPRPVGSNEGSRARQYILDAVKRLGFSPEVQAFPMTGPLAPHARLLTQDGQPIPCWPVIGSPPTSGTLRGLPRLLVPADGPGPSEGGPPGAFALAPLGFSGEAQTVAAATQRGAAAVLLYSEQVPELYSAVVARSAVPVPCVTVRRADALWLAQEAREVELSVHVEPTDLLGVNITVEIGNGGRQLLFLAHYDTRPGTPGAYRNASGVAALLELLTRLEGWREHRILVGFLDGEEIGAAGSRHCREVLQATGGLRGLRGVVYVSGLGLRRLSIAAAPRKTRSSLADRARQFAADEGVLASAPLPEWATRPIPAGIWSCPVIAVAGPPLAVEHTTLDRPGLLHPRYVSRAVSVLEHLARTP